MKSLSGKEFAKILERNGWTLSRINGSHHIYTKTGRIEQLSVLVHGNTDLKIGLLRHLMRSAGIREEDIYFRRSG